MDREETFDNEYTQEQGFNPPVKEGENYNLEVEGIGAKGDPFGKVLKYIIFIAVPKDKEINVGDMLNVRITRVTNKQAFSELSE